MDESFFFFFFFFLLESVEVFFPLIQWVKVFSFQKTAGCLRGDVPPSEGGAFLKI